MMGLYDPITVARFWSKVAVGTDKQCWEWRGATKTLGYGRMKVEGKNRTASRIAWELANGEPLGDRHALHTCDNPKCCNPYHIVAGTHGENMTHAVERGRIIQRPRLGEANPRARLKTQDVIEIKRRIAAGEADAQIAKDYPVSFAMIWRIRKGLSWSHVRWDETETERETVTQTGDT